MNCKAVKVIFTVMLGFIAFYRHGNKVVKLDATTQKKLLSVFFFFFTEIVLTCIVYV